MGLGVEVPPRPSPLFLLTFKLSLALRKDKLYTFLK